MFGWNYSFFPYSTINSNSRFYYKSVFPFLVGVFLGISINYIGKFIKKLIFNEVYKTDDFNEKVLNSLSNLHIKDGIPGLIGGTPMIRINSLSNQSGCEILGKMEILEPGGSAKDRVALAIINQAEKNGELRPEHGDGDGDVIFEGTSGSTGISLTMLARAKGYRAHICLPNDTSIEKINLLEKLGAIVEPLKPASIVDKNQYVNKARSRANELTNDKSIDSLGLFANQFENLANVNTHYNTTGAEIYIQTSGNLDAFVTGAGTGGTIAGVSKYLKEKNKNIKCILADPQGSGLHNKVKYGVMFDIVEREGRRKRHQVDTIVEGIGLNRLTANFNVGLPYVDDSIKVTDEQAINMAKNLVQNDGLFVGSSSAVNCVAALEVAKQLGPGHTIVTIICDSGTRHLSKFWK